MPSRADIPRRVGRKPGPLGPLAVRLRTGTARAVGHRNSRSSLQRADMVVRRILAGHPDHCCRPPVPRVAANNDAASRAMAAEYSRPPEVDVLHRKTTLPVAVVAIYQSIKAQT